MFKAAKQVRSSLIRNSLKSFIGTLNKENIWRKMEKLFQGNGHIVCFFLCITAMVENKKIKAEKRRNDSGSSEEDIEESNSNICGIPFWIVFN